MKQRNNKLNHTNTPSITNLLKRELPAEIKNHSDNGNQRGHNSGQNNNNHMVTFFSRKSNFYGHFQRTNSFHFYIISFKRKYVNCSLANFKRLASSDEKLYN